MRKAYFFALIAVPTMAAPGCDFLPAKDQSVVLRGTVLDDATGQAVTDMTWEVYTVRGWATEALDSGRTDAQGKFQARYEHPCCSDVTLEVNTGVERDYKVYAQQVYGRGKTITVTVRLVKRR